jgi:MscS family membrane protein
MTRRGRLGALSVVTMVSRAGKVLIAAVALVAAFGALGVNLTGWIAAFGIGGIAIALGAQKTIEHFVGSLTLIADQPMRVGDTCQIEGMIGTIEDIGMRSTRLRTLDRTLVTIPNGVLSSTRIENYSSRDRFRYAPVLNLRYETTPDQIRYLLVEIRSLLYAHARVTEAPARIRFVGFGASSLDLEIFAYVMAETYDEFLEVQEDLNLRIMDIVERSGTGFAFPSSTVYLRRDPEMDAGKREAAAAEVRERARAGTLPLPRFSQAEIDALAGTVPFDPASQSRQTRG